MTAPGSGQDDPEDYFAPPVPGHSPPPPQWYVPPPQRGFASVLVKVLAAVAIVAVLGFVAMAVFVVLAMQSYGDNK